MLSFWDALDEQERAALHDVARPRAFLSQTPLIHQGDRADHLMLLQEGWVKVTSTTADGHAIVLAVRGPGDLIGESGILGNQNRSATVTTLSPVRAWVLPFARFTAFLDAHPRVWRLVSGTFVQRLDEADRRLQVHVSALSVNRVARLLVHLARLSTTVQPPTPDGSIVIAPPLSQEELASWMDVSRETLARSLGELRRRGLIHTGWRKIVVLDLPGLQALIDSRDQHAPATAAPSGTEHGQALEAFDQLAEQLTPAERKVARLAIQGSTNREIAERLFITVSTVEQHLSRIYRKLNARTRQDLARLLPEQDRTDTSQTSR